MGRRPQPEIRQRLLEACTDHALAHGLPDRLEAFATAVGTSSRMLVYHFGTRDGLLREVLVAARARQVADFTGLLTLRPDEDYLDTLARAWKAISGAQGRPYLRIFSPLHDTAGAPHWPDFRREATTDWLAPLEQGMATTGHPGLGSVVLAVVRGLLMDLDATGDHMRVDAAFTDFLATVRAASSQTAAPTRRSDSSQRRRASSSSYAAGAVRATAYLS
ncbi:AcrR family transcriptional regulator [Motilibacter peucedani]|uniref:AcrR family transcriptional regulator n=1 Tax=Motilibacter peucedani TaxID=598650 RepID=A0A420XR42_9ACTN|nr:hypothetical protein [Motilibacter peucedani]RKS75717.1 AcrR family transcriptional regulator [Motilibacter peucedani]